MTLSPSKLKESLHSNIWHVGHTFMGNGFSYVRAHELYCKGIQCVDNIWDSENWNLHPWDEEHVESNLASTQVGDWSTRTTKFSTQWQHLLDDDADIMLHEQRINWELQSRGGRPDFHYAMLNPLQFILDA